MSGRYVHLHVGYEKTASSVIQDALMHLRPALAAEGLSYPVLEVAADGYPRSGNAVGFLGTPARRRALYAAAAPDAARGIVLSSEMLVGEHDRRRNLRDVARDARARGFDGLRVLLIIRDPASHAPSLWQQYVRNGSGLSDPIDRWLTESYDHPRLAADFLEAAASLPDVQVEVRNHSRLDAPIFEVARRWLALPEGLVPPPPQPGRDNVAASRSQTALMLALNRHEPKGRASYAVGARLRLADVRADTRRPEPSRAALEAMMARIEPDLRRAEALIPPSARYAREVGDPRDPDDGVLRFLPEEIDLLAQEVGALQARLSAIEAAQARWSPSARLKALRDHLARSVRRARRRLRPRDRLRRLLRRGQAEP